MTDPERKSTYKNIVWHPSAVTRERREAANGHRGAVLWFTGLPSSGKSTTAHAVENALFQTGHQAYVIDGDNIRHGLSVDLGFGPADRREHLRRIGELSRLLYSAGMIVLCAFISPAQESRSRVRGLIPEGAFLEIYCRCPVEVCAWRDPKGFYARARTGEIAEYTGVSAPYEEPRAPELILDTASCSVDQCTVAVMELLHDRRIIGRAGRDTTLSFGRLRL